MSLESNGSSDFDDAIDSLRRRVEPQGFVVDSEDSEALGVVLLEMPNGRSRRRMWVLNQSIPDLLEQDVENYRLVGDYQAVVNVMTGEIEAALTSSGSNGVPSATRAVLNLPGVEVLDDRTSDPGDETGEESVARIPESWRLRVSSGPRAIEISPVSPLLHLLIRGARSRPTIKLSGFENGTEEENLAVLDDTANAFLFDLDARYQTYVALARKRSAPLRVPRDRLDAPPIYPANNYPSVPLSLYRYGRASAGLPLLQYLAFYQVLEYFFPAHAMAEASLRLRNTLLNPRFNPASDEEVGNLVNLLRPYVSTHMGERDQLRLAVRACVEPEALTDFVRSSDRLVEHFCTKSQTIQGVSKLHLDGGADIRDQVADRIYAIRCRIVHSKQDGGGSSVDLLLPTSREAESLAADVELVRMLAQRALISRATRA